MRELKTEKRPWGGFTQFVQNEVCTVKVHHVKGTLSVQSHQKRDELWYLVKGKMKVYKGPIKKTPEETVAALQCTILNEGDTIEIPKKTAHAAENIAENGSELLEISFGDFDENDIIRYKDIYGRA